MFLRVRKFDVDRALKTYKKFFKIRLSHPTKFFPVGCGALEHKDALDMDTGALLSKNNPIDGSSVLILQARKWVPDSGFDIMDACMLGSAGLFSRMMEDEEVTVSGVRLILDVKDIGMGHLRLFPISGIRAFLYLITDGFPIRFKGFHVMNNHPIIDYLLMVLKPFLTKKVRERFLFHGDSMESLHEHIHPSILPEEYGGTDGIFSCEEFKEHFYTKHDEILNFSYFGYDMSAK